jgi:hypothetical protein
LVALRLYLVRGISARKRAPHPHPGPPPSRGRGFWFTQESKTARGQPQRREGSLGVIVRVAVIPVSPFRRLSLQTYTGNAVFL